MSRPPEQDIVTELRQAIAELREMTPRAQRFVSLADAGRMFGISKRQFYDLIRAGDIHGYKPGGGKVLVEVEELDRFIRLHKAENIDNVVEEILADAVKGGK